MNGKLPDLLFLLLCEDMASIHLEGYTQKDTILEIESEPSPDT